VWDINRHNAKTAKKKKKRIFNGLKGGDYVKKGGEAGGGGAEEKRKNWGIGCILLKTLDTRGGRMGKTPG